MKNAVRWVLGLPDLAFRKLFGSGTETVFLRNARKFRLVFLVCGLFNIAIFCIVSESHSFVQAITVVMACWCFYNAGDCSGALKWVPLLDSAMAGWKKTVERLTEVEKG